MLIHLKINPPYRSISVSNFTEGVSPYLVTHHIKNRSTLIMYKVMIKKGLNTLKNEANKRDLNETQEIIDNKKPLKKKSKLTVFAQSIKQ